MIKDVIFRCSILHIIRLAAKIWLLKSDLNVSMEPASNIRTALGPGPQLTRRADRYQQLFHQSSSYQWHAPADGKSSEGVGLPDMATKNE